MVYFRCGDWKLVGDFMKPVSVLGLLSRELKAGTCVMEMGWEGFPGILEQLLATAFHAHTP